MKDVRDRLSAINVKTRRLRPILNPTLSFVSHCLMFGLMLESREGCKILEVDGILEIRVDIEFDL